MAKVELSYRPMKNLTTTLAIRYPFYKAYETSSGTYGTDLIQRHETERIVNFANMIYLKLVYNFSFGKSQKEAKRKFNNEDKDTGILNRL